MTLAEFMLLADCRLIQFLKIGKRMQNRCYPAHITPTIAVRTYATFQRSEYINNVVHANINYYYLPPLPCAKAGSAAGTAD